MGRRKQPAGQEKLLQEILANHGKAGKPNKAAFAMAFKYSDLAKKSQRFGDNGLPAGMIAFRFRTPGDTLTGVLGECIGMVGTESWYPIARDDGSIVHVPGNRRLVKCFTKAKCKWQRITIVYDGRLRTGNGHFEKVYTVTAAPLNEQAMTAAGRKLIEQAAADAKARKVDGK
jgi:hypothetical protein